MNITREDIISAFEGEGASVDVSGLKGSDSLRDAGVDSLDMMNFFLGIEQNYNVKVPDEDLETLDTIDSIITYLERL